MEVDHALVIGGTGMLRRATIVIAERSRKLTAIARTAASLSALEQLLPDRPSNRYRTLNWNRPEQFVVELQRLVNEVGYPTLVLAWLHDANLGPRVAMAVSAPKHPCDFFHVIGSTDGSPHGRAAVLRDKVEAISGVRYFQIILGFKSEAGANRWLTNDEISTGVLDAITEREACRIVGTVQPWEK